MGKMRSLLLGGVIGAVAGVVFAPRHGESRRDALGRLRLAARPGRGALGAFAGTPCAAGACERERDEGPRTDDGRPPDTRGGDEDG
jgi:hypothetical protein